MEPRPQLRLEDIPADLRHFKPHTIGEAPKDARDLLARSVEARAEILPRSFQISDPFPIINQGAIGSCVGAANARMLQHFFWRVRGGSPVLSALQLYYLGRLIDGSIFSDRGTYNRSVLKGVQRFGAAPEALWTYDGWGTKYREEPTKPARLQAIFWRGFRYIALNSIEEVKSSIAQGYGAVGIFTLTQGAYQNRDTGDIPETYPGEPTNGAHAVWFDAYDDDAGRLGFPNSWSETWGNRGRGTLPYSFWKPDQVWTDLNELWTVRPL
jgi:hypothetical protein